MSGSGPIWTGAGVVAAGTAVAFFLRAATWATWVRVVAALVLAVSLANALYIENEIAKKREQLTHIFDR
ncbi:putative membrane protein [Mycobacterium ulcerans str. Harvey]|nr:putative membrane protein [Mycobacterium ulcerans str. Harvey]